MNPSKIQILGNFWDCQIYRGKLYLFTIEGTIKTINWNQLVESLQVDDSTNIALSYAFKNGRNLYHAELHELFEDNDIKRLLESKFEALSIKTLIVTEDQLSNFLIGEQDTPFQDLHVDSEVLSNRMYILSHNSLLSSSVHGKSKKYPVANKIQKHFDLYGFSMRANRYARLAISAGDDGLIEYNSASTLDIHICDDRRISKVTDKHSSFADYSFLSIYNSSLIGSSSLSYFTWDSNLKRDQPKRVKVNEFNESDIFKAGETNDYSLSWGSNEKLYRAVNHGVQIVRFNNYAKPEEPIFSEAKLLHIQPWKGKILSAYIAYFGIVMHYENAIVLLLSDESIYTITGQATRVRIFPRSLNYENHLHVILDDRLEIYSFNNDYFVNQKAKDFGVAFRVPKTFGFVRGGYATRYESNEVYYKINPNNIDNINNNSNDLLDDPF